MTGLDFNRAKPFYPFVINYIISLHGLLEIISRHFYEVIKGMKDKGQNIEAILKTQDANEPKHVKFVKDIFVNNLEPTKLIDELALFSELKQDTLKISTEEITKDFVDNHIYLLPFQMKAAGILLIMAFETTRDTYDNKDDIWNFFYHCRNAAAHGGQFNITSLKRFPANWDKFEITQAMNGTNLFKDDKKKIGLLSPADPLYLLHYIENQYIV